MGSKSNKKKQKQKNTKQLATGNDNKSVTQSARKHRADRKYEGDAPVQSGAKFVQNVLADKIVKLGGDNQ